MAEKGDKKDLLTTTALSAEDMARIRARKGPGERRVGKFSLIVYSLDGVRAIPLAAEGEMIIGREPPADVTIQDSSLSRQHASIEVDGTQIWVQDLGSTNGTWVNGEKIERVRLEPGNELVFGAVTTSIHALESPGVRSPGLQSHDRFQQLLEAELARAREFGRRLSLVMLCSSQQEDSHVSRWFPAVEEHLRRFDLSGLYSFDTAEILLPEADEQKSRAFAAAVAEDTPRLLFGMGVFPGHAGSAGELLDVTRSALRRADEKAPVQSAAAAVLAGSVEATAAGELVVQSKAMREVYETVERLAATAIPVLIIGETGSGKEVIARAVHTGGKRRDKPIRCVNCGAIPSQLVESTLFGHEKGAFTGAQTQAAGVFEAADGGTVLLDEIGELPAAAQAALLRVLETKCFCRVGSSKEIEVDVRILAATNRDLEAMVEAGEFRADLLYRLNAMTLKIPPLRERIEEIGPLALRFVQQANRANDLNVEGIDEEGLELLKGYAWPGNVRELRNAMERAVVIAKGRQVTAGDLPERIRGLKPPEPPPSAGVLPEPQGDIDLKAEVNRYEAELIGRVLDACRWDRTAAAKSLGVPLRTLSHKMQVYGIKKSN